MKIFSFLMMGAFAGMLMDENNGNNGGGGGGGNNNQNNQNNQNQGGGAKTVTMSQEQFDAIMARLPEAPKKKAAAAAAGAGEDDDDESADDLAAKAAKAKADKEKNGVDAKALESAISFNMGSKEWLKTNSSLLPKDIEGIFSAAEKETYDNQVQKASAIKSGVIQTFFKVQENLDLLTPAQKVNLEDWLKLTKNGKEEKAQQMFDSVFEPTFEMLKRIKKAAQVQTGGQRAGDDAENAYKDKLMKSAQKHFMGGKSHA